MAARKKHITPKLYELHAELEDIEPRIWRKILAPGSIKLPKLHDLLQLVMGWTDSHLHSFQFGNRAFSAAHGAGHLEELNMLDEKKYTLEAALGDSLREFVFTRRLLRAATFEHRKLICHAEPLQHRPAMRQAAAPKGHAVLGEGLPLTLRPFCMLEVTALSSHQIFVLRVHLDLHPRRLSATTMEHRRDRTSWERRGLRRAYR